MKENNVWFYEGHLMRRSEESSLNHSIVLPNENFSEKESETYNRVEVVKLNNKEPLGSNNNAEEKE